MRLLLFLIALSALFLPVSAVTAQQRADSALMQYLVGEGLKPYPVDAVDFYPNGSDKFRALLRDIDQAQHKVWIEYFIFANDAIGQLVMEHLVQAAQRGCDVRVVTDYYKDRERHFGMGTRSYADSLARLGVDFQMYDRFKVICFNHVTRDHRKIVVIDDRIGYIGGLNVADYYISGDPSYGGWRDMHARITGPAVEGMALLFHDLYTLSGGKKEYDYKLQSTDYDPQRRNSDYDPQHHNLSSVICNQNSAVYFERSQASRQKKAETRNALIAAFDAARDTIRLVSPYVLPTHTVRQAMIRALDRGVHMEVMFSKVGDIELISSGNYHFAQRLIRHGAHVYLVKGAFHHSKIMMVDGQFCMVGSANLNSRSMKFDLEASAFIFGAEPTQALNRIFEQDKQQSDTLTPAFYKENYSRSFRAKGWFADRFLTPFL